MEDTGEVQRQVDRVRHELAGRKVMITLLALTACWTGIAIMLTGAPNFLEQWFSPWSRYVVGGIAFISGTTTAVAGMWDEHKPFVWWTQVLGLAWLCLWYVAFAVAYVALVVSQGLFLVGPGEPLQPQVTGRVYVPVIYLGLAAMSSIPLVTMIRLGRPDPRERRRDAA